MKGTVFNLQKFSTDDGPGIRTTIFLKGCPLHCVWCANPESQNPRPEILHDAQKCVLCGCCEGACPNGAIQIGTAWTVDRTRCTACKSCVQSCPNSALELAGEEKDTQSIIAECLKDRDFYEESGGGITLSGGEVLMQADFARDILKEAKNCGIHTAVETCGIGTSEQLLKILPYTDLFLFDLKHHDTEKHRQKTGAGNVQIKENIKTVVEAGKEILIRIPVIPGFNDTKEDALQLASTMKSLGVKECQLLPFHQFGEGKYHRLHRPYEMGGVKALHPEDLIPMKQAMESLGITVKL